MLIGDNLGDFDSAFFGKTNKERWEVSVSLKDNFGRKVYTASKFNIW